MTVSSGPGAKQTGSCSRPFRHGTSVVCFKGYHAEVGYTTFISAILDYDVSCGSILNLRA